LDRPETCTDEFLSKCWEAALKRDPVMTPYEKLATSTAGAATGAALEFLARLTDDEAFRTALLVLRAYGFDEGRRTGLQERGRERLSGRLSMRPAVRLCMPTMYGWVQKFRNEGNPRTGKNDDIISMAAKFTLAQHGVPLRERKRPKHETLLAKFLTVMDELRKAYPRWEVSVDSNEPAETPKTGDTGRKLKVRMARPHLGADNKPTSDVRGVVFATDGSGLAPDNQWWRKMIRDGHFELCRVIEAEEITRSDGP
jgi:hypothetical protein